MQIGTADLIRQVMPNCKQPAMWAPHLDAAMTKYGINTDPDFVAAFLAQIAHESAELNRIEESLVYSAERLMEVWPKRFPTMRIASQYARNPYRLANCVYASRMGNGPEFSGDGWEYRGRGLKMITGKDNYKRLSLMIGVDLVRDPNLLLEPDLAALSAAAFWGNPKDQLSRLANDLPDDNDDADFVSITRVINGGTIGLERRRAYWKLARKALGLN